MTEPCGIDDATLAMPKSMSLTLKGCFSWSTNIILSSLMSQCVRPTLHSDWRATASWKENHFLCTDCCRHTAECSRTYLLDNQSDSLQGQRTKIVCLDKVGETFVQVLKDETEISSVKESWVNLDNVAFVCIETFKLEQGKYLKGRQRIARLS